MASWCGGNETSVSGSTKCSRESRASGNAAQFGSSTFWALRRQGRSCTDGQGDHHHPSLDLESGRWPHSGHWCQTHHQFQMPPEPVGCFVSPGTEIASASGSNRDKLLMSLLEAFVLRCGNVSRGRPSQGWRSIVVKGSKRRHCAYWRHEKYESQSSKFYFHRKPIQNSQKTIEKHRDAEKMESFIFSQRVSSTLFIVPINFGLDFQY